ncbi:MarR family winged helix-turn-helix transcriptional regulator [Qaidamihabitans albus]|uniref:MarR family winged helix-turn-helix transcriptional regulator n=1 Tax=Qaidamihabitans albus TaxID=2795733 RepID=UPI0018F274C1|nr:MarR family transcriptional regulator [Qaidamihabitans albus]
MSGTSWLSDEEQRVWRDFSAAVNMLRAHLEAQLQRDAGMPHAYYEILVVLSEAPGRVLRMSELASATRSSRSRLSHAVARMEASGWVRRESCPTDRRGAFAHLTAAGLAALEDAAPGHVEAVRASLFDALTPEQMRRLGEISAAIRDRLAPRCAEAEAEEMERLEDGERAGG